MKRKVLVFLMCLVLLMAMPITASADMGPKPSVRIEFTGIEGVTYYGTLLSKSKSTGPASAWDGNPEYAYRQPEDDDYDIWLKFVEYEEVYAGSFYGTLKSEVERIWAKGHTIIFDIDVQGGVNLKRIFGDQALSVFIQAPSVEVLRERLVGRGTDTEEAIERRVAKAASEMEFADGKFDYVLINDDLDTAKAEAQNVIGDFLRR